MKYCLLLMILVSTAAVQAQSKTNITLRTAAAFHSFQDYNYSALPYSGLGLSYGFGIERRSKKQIFSIAIDNQRSKLSNSLRQDQSRIETLKRTFVQGTISYLRYCNIRGIEFYYGLSNTTFFDRVDFPFEANNQVSYELSSTLNGAIELAYSITPKLSYTLKADLPMLSAAARPQDDGLPHMKNLEFDLGRALGSSRLYQTHKVFTPHFHHLLGYTFRNREFGLFYDYFGGYNKIVGKKGHVVQKLGVIIPIYNK